MSERSGNWTKAGTGVSMKVPSRIAAGLCGLLVSVIVSLAAAPDFAIFDATQTRQETDAVIPQLADKRVVFIGEDHERYDQHLSQLEIIRRLHMEAPGHWTIGVEYFQRSFQPYLDAYIAGTLSEREFLSKTEYFERWGYDYRLYRPIFRYAREQRIPLVGLNAERELTEEVEKVGLEGLSPADRSSLPQQIEQPDTNYRDRLHEAFEEHPGAASANFERFVQVQSVWDETMAQAVVAYLAAHPGKAMVVLAGSGHIAFGSGIPSRVKRRLPDVQVAILLPADKPQDDPEGADYLLVSSSVMLAPSGKMGITMTGTVGVSIKTVSTGSAAAKAGLRAGDRLVALDGQPIQSLGDVQIALLDKEPGEHLSLRAERQDATGRQEITADLILQK
jgi:uncharacterized iron-regulated protein